MKQATTAIAAVPQAATAPRISDSFYSANSGIIVSVAVTTAPIIPVTIAKVLLLIFFLLLSFLQN